MAFLKDLLEPESYRFVDILLIVLVVSQSHCTRLSSVEDANMDDMELKLIIIHFRRDMVAKFSQIIGIVKNFCR